MSYKITVDKVVPNPAGNPPYNDTRDIEIYKQVVEELDMVALVAVVNRIVNGEKLS